MASSSVSRPAVHSIGPPSEPGAPDAWDALLSDLEVMERAALEVLNRKDE